MIGRRGFLGALLAATGVAALDPERALWRPGKLISVPKHVHVPKWHQLHVTLNSPHSLEPMQGEFWEPENRCATEVLKERIDQLIRNSGQRTAQFQDLPLPSGYEYAVLVTGGELPKVRLIHAYDGFTDQFHRRYDVKVYV